MREISWLAQQLLDSQEELCSTELVMYIQRKGNYFMTAIRVTSKIVIFIRIYQMLGPG